MKWGVELIIGVSSDVGKIREINQDSFSYTDLDELPLFLVADGMGGHNAGEVASSIAVDTIKKMFYNSIDSFLARDIDVPQFIIDALSTANKEIMNMAKENAGYNGMGTTVTMAFLFENVLYVGHIGDSRAYLLRGCELVQLTQDHSLVAELVRNGSISQEEAINHPQKNIITRALGTNEEIKIDIISKEIEKDDIVILCTDGLTNMVSDERIKNILISNKDIQDSCNILIKTANDLGGFDNTTVMLIKID